MTLKPALFLGLQNPEHCLEHCMTLRQEAALSVPPRSLNPNEFTSGADHSAQWHTHLRGDSGPVDLGAWLQHSLLRGAHRSPVEEEIPQDIWPSPFSQLCSQVGPPFCSRPGSALCSLFQGPAVFIDPLTSPCSGSQLSFSSFPVLRQGSSYLIQILKSSVTLLPGGQTQLGNSPSSPEI